MSNNQDALDALDFMLGKVREAIRHGGPLAGDSDEVLRAVTRLDRLRRDMARDMAALSAEIAAEDRSAA